MATPAGDSYSVASGQTCYMGRQAPVLTWLAALTLGTWAQIGANTVQDVNPAQDATINPSGGGTNVAPWTPSGTLLGSFGDYSGAAWDEVRKTFRISGGGHAGYKGNEGYGQGMSVNNPAMVRRGYPSGSIQKPNAGGVDANGANASLLPDGRPHQTHTYNLLVIDPTTGDLIMLPSGYQWAGTASPFGYAFREATSDWDTTVTFAAPAGAVAGCGCYDPGSGRIFAFLNDKLCSFDKTTGARTDHFTTNGNWTGYYCHMEYDSTRQLMVVFSGGQQGGPFTSCSIAYFDPANPTAFTIATVTGGLTNWGPRGIAYDRDGDRYLVWNGGSNFTVVTPPASNPGTNAWLTSTLVCSGTPSSPAASGTWGRMRYSPTYKTIFLLNSPNERTWAIKLH